MEMHINSFKSKISLFLLLLAALEETAHTTAKTLLHTRYIEVNFEYGSTSIIIRILRQNYSSETYDTVEVA
jgi:hypothetical protein